MGKIWDYTTKTLKKLTNPKEMPHSITIGNVYIYDQEYWREFNKKRKRI